MTTRGLRNRNPGNIVLDGQKWRGELQPSQDKRFKTFASMEYGYRALMLNLVNYIKSGTDTIPKIIEKWAPPKENKTQIYINDVEKWTGISRTKKLDYRDSLTLQKLAGAISLKENGVKPDESQIKTGYELLKSSRPDLNLGEVVAVAGGGLLILTFFFGWLMIKLIKSK